MMATFVCIYTQTLIFRERVTVASVLGKIAQLSIGEQMEVLEELRGLLEG